MKKILLIFAAALAVLLCFTACDRENPQDLPDCSSVSDSTSDTTGSLPEALNIVTGGATKYKVIRPENCSKQVTDAAVALRLGIMKTYDLSEMTITTDFESRDDDPADRYEYEILVGSTNREQSILALGSIKYNDFVICVDGTRVVIAGNNDEKTAEAVDYFLSNYLGDNTLSLPADLSYVSTAEYPAAGVTLLGQPVSAYRVVYKSSYKSMAETVVSTLGASCGDVMSMNSDAANATSNEIVIGTTRRGSSGKTFGADDFALTVKDGSIFIEGGSDYAVGSGCRYLLNLVSSSSGDLSQSALSYSYTLPDRQVYIGDISKLAMHWDIEFDTPDWMTDFEEKVASMNDPDGRLMSCLHRGDMLYYPENSIEGIISAIRMGADMVEIDVRATKDGILVLMHDDSLSRMTNAEQFAGKNGFPSSLLISNWTYDQLCQLSLKERNGGTSAALTSYKIPTLDEAMKVCAERVFVRLDKLDQWNYAQDIWPLIQKYKAYTTVIFTWHSAFTSSNYALVKNYKKKMETAAGRSSFCFVGINSSGSAAAALNTINTNDLDRCVRLTDCDFSKFTLDEYLSKVSTILSGLSGRARCYIDAHGNNSRYETPECYAKLYDAGINILLVNKGLSLCQYIEQNYSAGTTD